MSVKRRNPNIHTTDLSKLSWTYVTKNDVKTTDSLRRRFGFDPLDLRDTRPPLQRPKLTVRDEYLFMILLYPVLLKTGAVETIEIDFFIQKDSLVTVNANGSKILEHLFSACSTDGSSRTALQNKVCYDLDVGHLLYRILSELIEQTFPMVVDLSDQINSIEKRMFTDFDKDLIQELLRVKINIVTIRKAIQGHKLVIRQLIQASDGRFPIHRLEAFFQRLVDNTKELWDTLEIQKDTINALHETNASLIDFRINQIMKTLTIFSVIVFPLTLLAALFGMNSINMPLVNHPHGFWIIIIIMLLGTSGMLFIFKRKKWL
ncbi:MAG: magnesium transporter CorA family protein [bacterium]|nr:magnesium transporter CorA family protein [bacterium]